VNWKKAISLLYNFQALANSLPSIAPHEKCATQQLAKWWWAERKPLAHLSHQPRWRIS